MDVRRLIIERARGLTILQSGDEVVKSNGSFHEVDVKALLADQKMFDALVRTYRNIFGDDEIWGEGAYCEKEGWGKMVSLSEFEQMLTDKTPFCRCGGKFIECHSPKILHERILGDLIKTKASSPFCVLIISDQEVNGFVWGTASNFSIIALRIIKARYRQREKLGKREVSVLREKLRIRNISSEEKLLYYDELAVQKTARQGISPVMFLVRFGLTHGYQNGCRHALFWTAKKSPIFKLALCVGFEVVHDTADGISFMFLEDFKSLLAILQNKSPEDVLSLMRSTLKLLPHKA